MDCEPYPGPGEWEEEAAPSKRWPTYPRNTLYKTFQLPGRETVTLPHWLTVTSAERYVSKHGVGGLSIHLRIDTNTCPSPHNLDVIKDSRPLYLAGLFWGYVAFSDKHTDSTVPAEVRMGLSYRTFLPDGTQMRPSELDFTPVATSGSYEDHPSGVATFDPATGAMAPGSVIYSIDPTGKQVPVGTVSGSITNADSSISYQIRLK